MALITGAAGFIGMNYLMKYGGVPFDIKYGDDINKIEDLEKMYRGGTIIHLAAESGVPQSIKDPDKSLIANTLGSYNVIRFAKEKGAKVILASSAAAQTIISPYGASKACMENYARAFNECYGLQYSALRFHNVYGPYSDKKTSVVTTMIQSALKTGEIKIIDGTQTRDFIYVEDVCRAINEAHYGVFQVGTGVRITLLELGETLKSIIDKVFPVKLTVVNEPQFNPPDSECDYLPLSNLTLLNEGLLKTLRYYDYRFNDIDG